MERLFRRRKHLGNEKRRFSLNSHRISFFLQEPQHNLDCPDLIEEYENRILQKSRYVNNDASTALLKRKPSLDQAPVPNKRGRPPLDRNYPRPQNPSNRVSEEASAFDRGYDAEKILGATDATVGETARPEGWIPHRSI